MSDEELVKNVFNMHKRWVEEDLEQSKAYAADCDFESMLKNFYKATLALKGLEAVFNIDVPEARTYTEQRKATIMTKDIPKLASILREKCKIHP